MAFAGDTMETRHEIIQSLDITCYLAVLEPWFDMLSRDEANGVVVQLVVKMFFDTLHAALSEVYTMEPLSLVSLKSLDRDELTGFLAGYRCVFMKIPPHLAKDPEELARRTEKRCGSAPRPLVDWVVRHVGYLTRPENKKQVPAQVQDQEVQPPPPTQSRSQQTEPVADAQSPTPAPVEDPVEEPVEEPVQAPVEAPDEFCADSHSSTKQPGDEEPQTPDLVATSWCGKRGRDDCGESDERDELHTVTKKFCHSNI